MSDQQQSGHLDGSPSSQSQQHGNARNGGTPAAPNRLASYGMMSLEQAIARLKVAEDALVLIGWSSTNLGEFEGSDRSDAAEQMWMIWAGMVGSDVTGVEANPEIDALLPSLAQQRRTKRDEMRRLARQIMRDED